MQRISTTTQHISMSHRRENWYLCWCNLIVEADHFVLYWLAQCVARLGDEFSGHKHIGSIQPPWLAVILFRRRIDISTAMLIAIYMGGHRKCQVIHEKHHLRIKVLMWAQQTVHTTLVLFDTKCTLKYACLLAVTFFPYYIHRAWMIHEHRWCRRKKHPSCCVIDFDTPDAWTSRWTWQKFWKS